MLAIAGIWPKDSTDVRFTLGFIYICIHVAMQYVDFVHSFGDLQEILDNLSESITYTMLLIKMAVFRKNCILIKMIDAMDEDIANHESINPREKKIYAIYNSMAKTFFKVLVPLVIATAILYYLRPLAGYLITSKITNNFLLHNSLWMMGSSPYDDTNVFQIATMTRLPLYCHIGLRSSMNGLTSTGTSHHMRIKGLRCTSWALALLVRTDYW